jgi:uncharacterized membrane protein
MDIAFGTFKASFKDHPVDKNGPKARDDAKSSLRLIPTQEFITYLTGSALCVVPWAYTALQSQPVSSSHALLVSSAVGFGPVLLSSIVTFIYTSTTTPHLVKMSFLANLFHLFFGTLFCSIPITYGCWLTVAP